MNFLSEPRDFEKLPPEEKRSLFFLRGLRDAVARDLEFELNTEKAAEWINDLATLEYAGSSFEKIKERIMQDRPDRISRKYLLLELFQKLCFRIGRLEYEGCHVPRDRWPHFLFNA